MRLEVLRLNAGSHQIKPNKKEIEFNCIRPPEYNIIKLIS